MICNITTSKSSYLWKRVGTIKVEIKGCLVSGKKLFLKSNFRWIVMIHFVNFPRNQFNIQNADWSRLYILSISYKSLHALIYQQDKTGPRAKSRSPNPSFCSVLSRVKDWEIGAFTPKTALAENVEDQIKRWQKS